MTGTGWDATGAAVTGTGPDVRVFLNPHTGPVPLPPPGHDPAVVHRRLPGYRPTPLVDAPALAAALGVGRLRVKDESSRLGLPAFKMLGASWATYRALAELLGADPEPWDDVAGLARRFAPLRPLTLVTATDGNHGRAVARMARLLGLGAQVFVPRGTARTRIQAIESEGAAVEVVPGSYEDAVARSAADRLRHLVVSDTSWPGYQKVPRWVIDGYSTIFWEIEEQVVANGGAGWPPDLVAVQIGVGALAAAVVAHFRRAVVRPRVRIIGVEPTSAACALESARAGRPVRLDGPQHSIMAELNCGTPSPVAWPMLAAGIDTYLAIGDDRAREAMRALAAAGIVSGESGAAGLAGLLALRSSLYAADCELLGLHSGSSVLVISTEGATDPEAYRRILGG